MRDKKISKKNITVILVIAVIFAVILRYATTIITTNMYKGFMKSAMTPQVVLGSIQKANIIKTLEAPGRIVAVQSVDLIPRVSGYLQKKHYKDGDFVKKGQTLFTIEQNEYYNSVQKAQANLTSALAEAKRADVDFQRAEELVKKDYISKSAFDDKLAQRDVARANVQTAKAVLSDAKRNYSYTTIKAPMDGKIGNINITEGNYVTTQSGALAKIVKMNPIYVSYSLDSKLFNELRNDTILPTVKQDNPIKVELTLTDGTIYEHTGKEDFWGNEISQSTGTIDLRATFENPDNILIPGDFVRVKIFSNTKQEEIVVPQSAVMQDSTGKYVFVVDENGDARIKRIIISGQHENNWIVERGLKEGEQIVVKGALKARDGQPVKVITQEEYEKLQEEGSPTVSTKSEEEGR